MRGDAFEASASGLASKITYGGAGWSLAGWIVSSEGVALCGLLVAVGGLLVNWYYKAKHDRRQQEEHNARMAGLLQTEVRHGSDAAQ